MLLTAASAASVGLSGCLFGGNDKPENPDQNTPDNSNDDDSNDTDSNPDNNGNTTESLDPVEDWGVDISFDATPSSGGSGTKDVTVRVNDMGDAIVLYVLVGENEFTRVARERDVTVPEVNSGETVEVRAEYGTYVRTVDTHTVEN